MKKTSLAPPAAALALIGAVLFASATFAQAPPAAGPPADGAARPARSFPAPTNLHVLPKDITGQQLHETMEHWASDLGVHCDTCHAVDPSGPGPNGRPRMNFAADEKSEKAMARIMYTMLETDKSDYVAKVAAMDKMAEPAAPLTCGTCHRGHLDPEAFTPTPPGAPAAMPPMQH